MWPSAMWRRNHEPTSWHWKSPWLARINGIRSHARNRSIIWTSLPLRESLWKDYICLHKSKRQKAFKLSFQKKSFHTKRCWFTFRVPSPTCFPRPLPVWFAEWLFPSVHLYLHSRSVIVLCFHSIWRECGTYSWKAKQVFRLNRAS